MKAYGLFEAMLRSKGLAFEREYKFHSVRKWRADYAFPSIRLLVEIEGGAWIGGRHTSGSGFVADMEKYNAATLLGWSILRFQPAEVEKGYMAAEKIAVFAKTFFEKLVDANQGG